MKKAQKRTKGIHESLWCDPQFNDILFRTMRKFRFFSFPRTFGNPRQEYVSSWPELVRHVRENDGIKTCFTSHNSYMREEYNDRGKIMPQTIFLSKIFYDLDDEDDLRRPYMDVCRLKAFSRDHNLPYAIAFSASKGFHFYHQLTSRPLRFAWKDETDLNLIKVIRGIQYYLQDHLSLETLDPQSTGEPKKLCRLPFTWHVDRKGKVSDARCIPVNDSMFDPTQMAYKLRQIEEMSKTLSVSDEPYWRTADNSVAAMTMMIADDGDTFALRPDLREFIRLAKIDFSVVEAMFHRSTTKLDWEFDSKDATYIFGLLTRGPHRKPCLVTELMTINPHHKARFAFGLFCKQMGYSRDRFARLYDAIAATFGYVDYEGDIESREREYQIDSIFYNPHYLKPPTCGKIKTYGLCLGPQTDHNVGCDRWRNTLRSGHRFSKRKKN